jgi:aspartyl-tRNA(Asn)/glutamyl-tRNA(Gln) amidotransferase subunit C
MLSKEEVQKIAKLARLGITIEEEEKFAKDLSSVLDYIEKLKEVEVSGVVPASHAIPVENVMREDVRENHSDPKKLLDLAPETKDNFLKVKSVFK